MCDLGGTQTHDLWNRNPTLYSTKLRDLRWGMYAALGSPVCGGIVRTTVCKINAFV